ncbi:MAG: response regulator [Sutterella wadsworthensis]|nr:response regulator [Sutterella wadsworthensis]
MERNRPVSVVLVDEYPLFRKAMADLLVSTGEFQVLGQTSEGDTALGLASLGPDIVVMSLEAEEYSALELLKEIKYRQRNTRVVMVMSSANSSGQLMRAIRLDANGYLLRTISPTDFIEQMKKTANGGMAASEKVTTALAEKLRGDTYAIEEVRKVSALTSREQDVLGYVASGISNQEIAKRLGISEGTVKVHVKHTLKKLNFRSRVELAVWAAEHGFKVKMKPS